MRSSTSALALGAAAAFSFSGVALAAGPRGGDAPPHAAAAPDTAPSSTGTLPAESAPEATPPPDSSGEATPAPDSSSAAAKAGPGEAAPHAGAPHASPVAPKAAASPEQDSDEDHVEPVTAARDTVGGHFAVGLDAGVVLPFGSVESGVPQSRTMGPGLTLGGDVAYGVSRTVMLGVYADVGLPSARGAASKDNVSTIALGPLVRYHLAQGTRFDPWVSGGFGFRRTSAGGTSFTGVDWARLGLGGDWYPAANFGFGPFLELSMGTFFAESPGALGTKSLDAHFLAGGRIVFDGPGK